MSSDAPTYYLGTSGWSHRDWVGPFYPHDMLPGAYLAHYATHFNTVEIEATFYDLPARQAVRAWRERAPEGFQFSPCLPRQMTHGQRLREVGAHLDDFLDVITELEDKLGPILIQLPEDFRVREHDRLESFLATLPTTQRFALEFRHGSWLKDTTYELLEAYQVAWVDVEAPFLPRPRAPRVTAPFAFVRWHGRPGGAQRARHQTDPATAMRPWIPFLNDLARQAAPVYGYVRNSFSGYAPRDCLTLQRLLGLREGERAPGRRH